MADPYDKPHAVRSFAQSSLIWLLEVRFESPGEYYSDARSYYNDEVMAIGCVLEKYLVREDADLVGLMEGCPGLADSIVSRYTTEVVATRQYVRMKELMGDGPVGILEDAIEEVTGESIGDLIKSNARGEMRHSGTDSGYQKPMFADGDD